VVVPLAAGRLPDAVRRVLAHLDAELAEDAAVAAAVTTQVEELEGEGAPRASVH
jgi:hypothetical protein